MSHPPEIQRIAVIGGGLIGSSWAAHFLGRGLDVTICDPAPGAEERIRGFVDRAWPVVTQLGLAPGATRERLRYTAELDEAVSGAQFVQENGPEREDFKIALFAELDDLVPADVIIASSTSGLSMSTLQSRCRHPERCVIGHPFNPPHLIPLVEVVGGRATSAQTVEQARAFYTRMGKKAIVLHREVPGHVANRLQAALWREVVHLVDQGVISVADADDAVSFGPGLRWGLMGPNLIFHLGGGPGGMEHFLAHLSGPFSRWWDTLGEPVLTPELKERLVAGVKAEAAGRSITELERQRDQLLLGLLALRRETPAAAAQSPATGGTKGSSETT